MYMEIAWIISKQSYCKRRQVGAVLVSPDKKNILGYGFNGTISGFPNVCELEDGTTDNETVLHAETNAIMKVSRSSLSTKDSHLYVTLSPCVDCAKLIIQAGVATVTYSEEYKCIKGIALLRRANIEVIQEKQ